MKSAKRKKPDVNRKRAGGKFVKGCSGNPTGRPPGISDKRVQLRALLEPSKERLIRKAVSLALAGDTAALRLCLERLIPVLRPVSEPVQVSLPVGKTLSEQAQIIFTETINGKLSTDDAARLLELLIGNMKIISETELEQRISKLESMIEGGEFNDNER